MSPRHHAVASRSLGGLPPSLHPIAAGAAALAPAGAALSGLAWTRPTTSVVPFDATVLTMLDFSYTATVPRSAAYDGTTVTAPQPVFRRLAEAVDGAAHRTGADQRRQLGRHGAARPACPRSAYSGGRRRHWAAGRSAGGRGRPSHHPRPGWRVCAAPDAEPRRCRPWATTCRYRPLAPSAARPSRSRCSPPPSWPRAARSWTSPTWRRWSSSPSATGCSS